MHRFKTSHCFSQISLNFPYNFYINLYQNLDTSSIHSHKKLLQTFLFRQMDFIQSMAEHFKEHPSDYNLLRAMVEGKTYTSGISEFDIEIMFAQDPESFQNTQLDHSSYSTEQLLPLAIQGITSARYQLGANLLWEYRQYHEQPKFIIGMLLLFTCLDHYETQQYFSDSAGKEIIQHVKTLISENPEPKTLVRELIKYLNDHFNKHKDRVWYQGY